MNKPKQTNWGFINSKLVKLADPGKQGLTSTEKGVLEAIADHMGGKRRAWPGYGTIAHFAGCDRSTAIRTVKKLISRGLLRKQDGATDSNQYEIDTHALADLITKTKYQQKAEKLLRKLAEERAVNGLSSGTVPPPQWQDATTTSGTVPPPSGRTPPERTQERPTSCSKNAPPGESDLRSEQGERGDLRSEGGVRLSPFIKNHEVCFIIEETETVLAGTLATSTRPVDSVAASVVKLFGEIKEETGRYPSPEEIVDSIGDPIFRGLRNLSFGFLTGKRKREEFKAQLLRRVRNTRLMAKLNAPNSADVHDTRVELLKRETMIQFQKPVPANLPIPEADYNRLPRHLQEKVLNEWNDPDVPGWVADELAKEPKAVEPMPVPPQEQEPAQRPLGYSYDSYDIEKQLAEVWGD